MSKTDEGIKTKLTVSRLMKSLVVMLPTLDEEHGLRSVLSEMPNKKLENMGWNINIWVVDGGSEDQTIAIAEEHGCEVVKQAGTGKGAAMRTGFTKFLSSKPGAAGTSESEVMQSEEQTQEKSVRHREVTWFHDVRHSLYHR